MMTNDDTRYKSRPVFPSRCRDVAPVQREDGEEGWLPIIRLAAKKGGLRKIRSKTRSAFGTRRQTWRRYSR